MRQPFAFETGFRLLGLDLHSLIINSEINSSLPGIKDHQSHFWFMVNNENTLFSCISRASLKSSNPFR